MDTLQKNCLQCNKVFEKRSNCSLKEWNEKSKFCSKQCYGQSLLGIKLSNETIEKLKGRTPPNKGKTGFIHSEATKQKMLGRIPWNKGKAWSEETKAKLREARKKQINVVTFQSGSAHPFWKGGKTSLKLRIRNLRKYKDWRKFIYERDDYTCLKCEVRGGKLDADHIKPFSVILNENQIETIEQAIECKELWDTSNGRTLCRDCHKKTKTWGVNTLLLTCKVP